MKKILNIVLFLALFVSLAHASYADVNNVNRHISMTTARLFSLREFDRKTGGAIKSFRCSLADETPSEWIFNFDNYENPPGPGGSDLTVFVNKRTGAVKSLFGK